MRVNKQAVLKLLDASGISYESVEHEAVFKFGQKNLVAVYFHHP